MNEPREDDTLQADSRETLSDNDVEFIQIVTRRKKKYEVIVVSDDEIIEEKPCVPLLVEPLDLHRQEETELSSNGGIIHPPSNADQLLVELNVISDDGTNSREETLPRRNESPQPSTSRGIVNRKPDCTPAQLQLCSTGTQTSDGNDKYSSGNESIANGSELESDSDFEPIIAPITNRINRKSQQPEERRQGSKTVLPKKSKRRRVQSPVDSSSEDEDPMPRKGKYRRIVEKKEITKKNDRKGKKRKSNVSPPASESDKSQDDSESGTSSSGSDVNQRGTGREKRSLRKTREKGLKNVRASALEALQKKREERAKKPKRPSPVRVLVSDKSESSSDSNYTVEIVEDYSSMDTDYTDASTPSSSSVTSSGNESEEPDLESGSDGEKDLPQEPVDSDYDDGKQVKSCSSSDDDGTPDDGQNDSRCILCKNLGSAVITGRAELSTTDWCKCGECTIFHEQVEDYDLVCCREIKTVLEFLADELEDDVCVTKHGRFERDVLKYEGLARSLTKHQAPRRFSNNSSANFYENFTCGKGDDRLSTRLKTQFKYLPVDQKMRESLLSYIYWIFDQQNEEEGQMLVPACVQRKVREKYESENFQPFKPRFQCLTGRHCREAK